MSNNMNYVLKVFEESFSFEESCILESHTPFHAISVGDTWVRPSLSSAEWHSRMEPNDIFIVKSVEHEVSDVNGKATSSILRILLEKKEMNYHIVD